MNRIIQIFLLVVYATTAVALEAPTKELGEKLFNDSRLGSSGKSCVSCHSDGSKLKETSAYDDEMLKEMINFCIRDALKGTMLHPDSSELNSLLLYLRVLEQ